MFINKNMKNITCCMGDNWESYVPLLNFAGKIGTLTVNMNKNCTLENLPDNIETLKIRVHTGRSYLVNIDLPKNTKNLKKIYIYGCRGDLQINSISDSTDMIKFSDIRKLGINCDVPKGTKISYHHIGSIES